MTQNSDTSELIKGCLSDYEIEKTISLLDLVWPDTGFTKDYLHWLYCENPVGLAEIYNVWDKGEIVAHYATIPIKANLFGIHETGLLSLNSAVHPSCRGKGYFKTLAIQTFEYAKAKGINFVIGVANANSTLLFRRQLKFQLVCPLTVKIGFGTIKHLPVQPEKELDYIQIWDIETLSWRLKRPSAKYRVIKKNNFVSILAHSGKYGIWANMYNLHSDELGIPSESVFRWNPFEVWIGLDSSYDWANSFYTSLPDRFKSSPLNLIFKDLSGHERTLDPKKIIFSLLNFDAF
jgi:GNAT superfamily N-acetyltransferase